MFSVKRSMFDFIEAIKNFAVSIISVLLRLQWIIQQTDEKTAIFEVYSPWWCTSIFLYKNSKLLTLCNFF